MQPLTEVQKGCCQR